MTTRDYCTLWPEGNWAHCCKAHDQAYASGVNRATADAALEQCVAATGNPDMALIMFVGVTLFGGIAWTWLRLRQWWRGRDPGPQRSSDITKTGDRENG